MGGRGRGKGGGQGSRANGSGVQRLGWLVGGLGANQNERGGTEG